MTLSRILLLSLLTILALCNGHNASPVSYDARYEQVSSKAIGETVSELGKSIWIIFQDKKDNYWFGSDGQGVYRFDGKSIIRFSTKDGLPDNRIRGIQEDKSGNVFITSLEGISKYDGQAFTTLTLPVLETHAWMLDSNDLWFSILGKPGQDGPYRYDGTSLHHLRFPKHYLEDEFYAKNPNPLFSPYEVYTIYRDGKGHLWFGTAALGVCRYDGKSLSWMYERELTETPSGGSFGIRSIIEDREGKFWFCNTRYRYNILPTSSTEQGRTLVNYNREKGIDNLKAPDGEDLIYFMSAIEDKKGELWMVSYKNGVWRYDGQSIAHSSVKDGAKDITLFSIYKDNHGDLWLGTHDAGAYKFNGKTFENFRP